MTSKINLSKGEVQVDLISFKDGKYYVAYIPALNLSAHSEKRHDAVTDLQDAVSLFFEYWIKSGKLDEKLLSLGWEPITDDTGKMLPSNESIKIPYSLLDKNIKRKSINIPAYC